jgi:hypothetical protein
LLEGDVFLFESSEGSWELPAPVVDEGELATVGAVVGQALNEEWPRETVETALGHALPSACCSASVLSGLGALYAKILELHHLERNGMWWQILGNAFAPMLQGSFDLVVGNPPWVSWETLPESYRRSNDSQWLDYGLRPDVPLDRRQASAQVRLDLSMLFVARAMDKLLRDGGRLGFVITATVFKSELAGRGFRRRRLPNGTYRICHIEDLSRLSVFDSAANQTALMIASKEQGDSYPVPVVEWSRAAGQPRTVPPDWDLTVVLDRTVRTEVLGEPVSPRDDASPLIVLPEEGLVASRDLREPSFYAERVREGINTRGANGVFFLELLETDGPLVRVRNVVKAGRNRATPIVEEWLERAAVRDLLRGEDVQRATASPSLGLLFFHDAQYVSRPMPDSLASLRFPKAYAFAKRFEPALRARKQFRGFDPSGESWLGLYSVTQASLAEHKVVFREIADKMIAAPVHSADVIPDHKLHVIPCESADEAVWLADVLNSDVVDRLVRSFALTTSIGGSLFRYVGIRNLSTQPMPPPGSGRIEKALGLRKPQLELLRKALDVV